MAIDNKTLYLQSKLPSLIIGSEEIKNPIVTTDEVAVEIQKGTSPTGKEIVTGFTSLTTKLVVQWMYHLIIS